MLVHTHTHLTALFSGTTQVSQYQTGKTNLDFRFYWRKRQWVAVASAGPYASLHLAPDRKSRQQQTTQFFTGRMPFLPPNQQRQSTEGIKINSLVKLSGVIVTRHLPSSQLTLDELVTVIVLKHSGLKCSNYCRWLLHTFCAKLPEECSRSWT